MVFYRLSQAKLPSCALSVILLSQPQHAAAVDFKIDMPSQAGKSGKKNFKDGSQNAARSAKKTTLLAENTQLDIPDLPPVGLLQSDGAVNRSQAEKSAPDALDSIPESPFADANAPEVSSLDSLDIPSFEMDAAVNQPLIGPKSEFDVANIGDWAAFPTPSCLKENVQFWGQVYTQYDVNDVIFHDKSNLKRVFLILKLPASPRERVQILQETKDALVGRLLTLAKSVDRADLWDAPTRQLAKLYPGVQLTEENIKKSIENIRGQNGLRSRFEAGVQRSIQYLPTIHQVMKTQGLPLDLVNLPHVESSYVLNARSKVGAVGLWQIMPETMRQLMGNKHVNSRMELETSTIAAAKLLRQNYEVTKSWPLALTAYNHGINGVSRAIKKTGSRNLCDIIARYDSPSFQFASGNFYAQFLAARNAALERYVELAKIQGHGKILRQVLALGSKGKS